MDAQTNRLDDRTVDALLALLFSTGEVSPWANYRQAPPGITRDAFAVAVENARPRLVAFAKKLIGAWPHGVRHHMDVTAVATEIVGDALCVAWEHRAQFRGECSIVTWLGGIVKNIAKRQLRTRARRLAHEVPALERRADAEGDEDAAAFDVADLEGLDSIPLRRVRAPAQLTCPSCGGVAKGGTACGQCGLGLPRDLEPDYARYRTAAHPAALPSERRSGLLHVRARIEDRILLRGAVKVALTKELARHPAWFRDAVQRFLAGAPRDQLAVECGLSARVLSGKLQRFTRVVLQQLDGGDYGGAHE